MSRRRDTGTQVQSDMPRGRGGDGHSTKPGRCPPPSPTDVHHITGKRWSRWAPYGPGDFIPEEVFWERQRLAEAGHDSNGDQETTVYATGPDGQLFPDPERRPGPVRKVLGRRKAAGDSPAQAELDRQAVERAEHDRLMAERAEESARQLADRAEVAQRAMALQYEALQRSQDEAKAREHAAERDVRDAEREAREAAAADKVLADKRLHEAEEAEKRAAAEAEARQAKADAAAREAEELAISAEVLRREASERSQAALEAKATAIRVRLAEVVGGHELDSTVAAVLAAQGHEPKIPFAAAAATTTAAALPPPVAASPPPVVAKPPQPPSPLVVESSFDSGSPAEAYVPDFGDETNGNGPPVAGSDRTTTLPPPPEPPARDREDREEPVRKPRHVTRKDGEEAGPRYDTDDIPQPAPVGKDRTSRGAPALATAVDPGADEVFADDKPPARPARQPTAPTGGDLLQSAGRLLMRGARWYGGQKAAMRLATPAVIAMFVFLVTSGLGGPNFQERCAVPPWVHHTILWTEDCQQASADQRTTVSVGGQKYDLMAENPPGFRPQAIPYVWMMATSGGSDAYTSKSQQTHGLIPQTQSKMAAAAKQLGLKPAELQEVQATDTKLGAPNHLNSWRIALWSLNDSWARLANQPALRAKYDTECQAQAVAVVPVGRQVTLCQLLMDAIPPAYAKRVPGSVSFVGVWVSLITQWGPPMQPAVYASVGQAWAARQLTSANDRACMRGSPGVVKGQNCPVKKSKKKSRQK